MIDSFLKYLQFEKRVSRHTLLAYKTDLQQFSAFIQNTFAEFKPEAADYGMIRSWIINLVEGKIEAFLLIEKSPAFDRFTSFCFVRNVSVKIPC